MYHNYVKDYGSGCSVKTIWSFQPRLCVGGSVRKPHRWRAEGREEGVLHYHSVMIEGFWCVVTEAAGSVNGNQDRRTRG